MNGQIRYNTSDNQVQVYYNGGWLPLSTGAAAQDIGTQSNPAIDGNALMAAGKSSGIYWIQPEGQSAYQMMLITVEIVVDGSYVLMLELALAKII